jgi:hypothetical protein
VALQLVGPPSFFVGRHAASVPFASSSQRSPVNAMSMATSPRRRLAVADPRVERDAGPRSETKGRSLPELEQDLAGRAVG